MSFSSASSFDEIDQSVFQSLLQDACGIALPTWLETRRWFADKGRGIAAVEIEDALIERVEPHWLALAVTRVMFKDGFSARYLLSLALTPSPGTSDAAITQTVGRQPAAVVDATETVWFGEWLLRQIQQPGPNLGGSWSFVAHATADAQIAAARGHPARVVRAEQSNSSLRFGDVLMAKLFRRLQPGPNPDEEVLRALADAGFDRVPRYAGFGSWRSAAGETFAIALIQEFVPNIGDGWTWMLERLEGVAGESISPQADDFAAERLLGRRTGELHGALGSVQEPGFTPEKTTSATVAADARRTRAAIEETVELLLERQEHLPETLRTRVSEINTGLRDLSERVDGFGDETDTVRIRVHGDYHLGQTLRTSDEDWTIIDFEGEPARPLDERRQPTSPLKDVAGMLRSFAYARGVAERGSHSTDGQEFRRRLLNRRRLLKWEIGARRAFLEGYRQALSTWAISLIPSEEHAFNRALAAWELDKALYEVAYEARNRPDWIELPLRALLPDLFAQPAENAGTSPA